MKDPVMSLLRSGGEREALGASEVCGLCSFLNRPQMWASLEEKLSN